MSDISFWCQLKSYEMQNCRSYSLIGWNRSDNSVDGKLSFVLLVERPAVIFEILV
jgi:hypothetical protein